MYERVGKLPIPYKLPTQNTHFIPHFSMHHHTNTIKIIATSSDAIPVLSNTHTSMPSQEIHDDGDRITIDKYERNTVITVRRTTRPDSGKYKLVLTNSSGTCESIGDVVVLGKCNFYILAQFPSNLGC